MSSVFDDQEMMERVAGDRELLAELVLLLREECERLVPTIERALRDGDRKELEQAAHKLKGSVGQMAAVAAYETARLLEMLAREGDLAAAGEYAARLGGEVSTLLEALESFAGAKEGP